MCGPQAEWHYFDALQKKWFGAERYKKCMQVFLTALEKLRNL
jgi:hypothetical protein